MVLGEVHDDQRLRGSSAVVRCHQALQDVIRSCNEVRYAQYTRPHAVVVRCHGHEPYYNSEVVGRRIAINRHSDRNTCQVGKRGSMTKAQGG